MLTAQLIESADGNILSAYDLLKRQKRTASQFLDPANRKRGKWLND